MAWAHDYLRAALAGGPADGEGSHWDRILAALRVFESDRSAETEAVLREVLQFQGELVLHLDSSLPHAMAPLHMLQSTAMHMLAEWDMDAHRDVITQVASTSQSAHLVRIAQGHLNEGRTEP